MNKNKQMMFDKDNNIVEEPIRYWKSIDEVPENIKKFILDTVCSKTIYDVSTKQYYCSKCLKALDNNYYCSNCNMQCRIPISNKSKYVIYTNINDIKEYREDSKFFVFDIVDGEVLIYIFRVDTCYYNRRMYVPYQINKISIEEVYYVLNNKLVNLLNNSEVLFEDYSKEMDDSYNYDLLDIFDLQVVNHYLYTDNLCELQKTLLYEYTFIWKLKNFFMDNNFTLSSLTYYPICCKQFEYLVKMKLYRLAATGPDVVKFDKNFKNTFGVDKKYYSFMKDIDISVSQLNALRICPTTNIDLINFISTDTFLFEELSEYVKVDKIKTYFEKEKLDYHNIYEYYDYIRCCKYLSLNMEDKNILFPKEFIRAHDKITGEMVIATDPKINERIHTLSNLLLLNKYEDDKYVIFPADSVESLIDESSQMSNCVRNYCLDVSNNECQIYFMRYKDNLSKSLITIEVRDGKIVQARAKFNELPGEDEMKILKKWERDIISITN